MKTGLSINEILTYLDWFITVNKLQSLANKTKFMLIGSAHKLSAKGKEVTNSINIMNNIVLLNRFFPKNV